MKSNNCKISVRRQLEKTSNTSIMYHQLKAQNPMAVRLLCEGIKLHLQCNKYRFSTTIEDLEELANDAAILVLRKISDGSYRFFGVSPMSFANTVADNLLRNFCRKKQLKRLELCEAHEPIQQPEVEAYFAQKELKNQVENALSKLSEASQLVLRLKYFEDLRDEEIVRFELSPHRTTDSLKSSRCRSLKRLAEIMSG